MIPALLSSLSFGFLGSLHCAGMCGGFIGAMTFGREKFWKGLFVYQAGRIFTYSAAGFLAGLSGVGLGKLGGGIIQALIALLAGFFMIMTGLNLAGIISDPFKRLGNLLFPVLKIGVRLRKLQQYNTMPGWFFTGIVNGLLPCGMVYAALLLALASENMTTSILVMTFFGIGTIPAMMFTPVLLRIMTPRLRLNTVRWAGVFLIFIGIFTSMRGVGLPQNFHYHAPGVHNSPLDETCKGIPDKKIVSHL